MGKLQTKVAECDNKEYNRELMEQFIHGLNDEDMHNKLDFEGGLSIKRH